MGRSSPSGCHHLKQTTLVPPTSLPLPLHEQLPASVCGWCSSEADAESTLFLQHIQRESRLASPRLREGSHCTRLFVEHSNFPRPGSRRWPQGPVGPAAATKAIARIYAVPWQHRAGLVDSVQLQGLVKKTGVPRGPTSQGCYRPSTPWSF